MKGDNIEIELNHFKIIRQVWKDIYSTTSLTIWVILSLVYPVISFVATRSSFIEFHPINFATFIFPGVTGLSFSMTLLNATRTLYDVEDLKNIYLYTDSDNPIKGYLYYRTIAPFIVTSYLWLIVSIVSLFSSIFTIKFPTLVNEFLLSVFFSILIAGFMSIWSLVSTHLSDLSQMIKLSINSNKK